MASRCRSDAPRIVASLTCSEAELQRIRSAQVILKPLPQLYLAGPMTGLPDLNFPAFHTAAKALRERGYRIVNPAELNTDLAADWLSCMRVDIAELVRCDGVVLLPGWELSRGARVEQSLAEGLGLIVVTVAELLA